MNTQWSKTIIALIMVTGIIVLGCTSLVNTGPGSETVAVTGQIVDSLGRPVEQARVMLLPALHNPLTGPAIPDSMRGITDESGYYAMKAPGLGTYYVEATDINSKYKALTGITIDKKGTVTVPESVLRRPGTLRVVLPDTVNETNGYVYLPGTTCYARTQSGSATVIAVPPGFIPAVYYANTVVPARNHVIQTALTVLPGETRIIADTSSWKHSKKLFLNTTASGAQINGDIENFPVLVRLTQGNFNFTETSAQGEDIRFMKSDGTPVPYEIERWDAANRQAEIWVKVDTIRGNDSTQSITLYWGNPDASANSNSAAVFDTTENSTAVWHLSQNWRDATFNRHDGAAGGSADSAGLIGLCKKFTHSDSIVIAGLLGTPQSLTLSAWVQLDSTQGSGGDIISIGDAAIIRMDYQANNFGTGGAVHLSDNDTVFAHVGSGKYLRQTGWHFITLTHAATSITTTVYIDGIQAGIRTDPDKPINYNGLGQNTVIGNHGNGKTGFAFFGRIDEARVYRTALSADYIKLSFMNQREADRLIVFK